MKNKFDHLKEKLMTDIASGVLTPAPRWKKILQSVLLVTLVLAIFLLTALVFVYLFHALRSAGISALLGFGWRGIILFLFLIPWSLIVVDILFVLLLIHIAKRFEIAWKVPRLYLAMFLLLAAWSAGYVLDRPVNERMEREELYERPAPPPVGEGFTHGIILTLDASECILSIVDERTGDTIEVWAVPPACEQLVRYDVGESVILAGTDEDGILTVYGIRHDIRPSRRED